MFEMGTGVALPEEAPKSFSLFFVMVFEMGMGVSLPEETPELWGFLQNTESIKLRSMKYKVLGTFYFLLNTFYFEFL